MGRQLKSTVAATDPDTGALVWLQPDSELPGWAGDVVTNPKAWEDATEEPGDADEAEPGEARQVEAEQDTTEPEPAEDEGEGEEESSAEPGYAGWTVAMLRGEIQSRNTTRDEGDRIPVEGNKADLVEALQADDDG